MTIRFTILGEPASKANSRKIVMLGKRPGVIKSEKAREYEKAAALQIPADARQMLTGPVKVTLHIFYASERPDLDPSVILDVMQARYERTKGKLAKICPGNYAYAQGERVLVAKGVYINDRQVRELHCFHAIDRANPRAEIEIEPLVPQQGDMELAVPRETEEEGVPF